MTVHSGSNTGTYFYSYDGNGNVVAMISTADGTIAARYEYSLFGELLRASGLLAFVNPFRFSTKYQDDETRFLYYGTRYHDPNTGRWLSRDPVEERGGLPLYAFVFNNPTLYFDDLGTQPRLPAGWRGPGQLYDPRLNPFSPSPRGSSVNTGPGFSNTDGFLRWLVPIGGTKELSWNAFDPTGNARRALKLNAVGRSASDLQTRIQKAPCGSSTLNGVIFYFEDVFESPIAWISRYRAYAVGANPDLEKDCTKCTFVLRAPLTLRADDRSNFNPGENFHLGRIPIPDSLFIFIRDWTPLGVDYWLWASTQETHELKGKY